MNYGTFLHQSRAAAGRLACNEILRCEPGSIVVIAPDCSSMSTMCLGRSIWACRVKELDSIIQYVIWTSRCFNFHVAIAGISRRVQFLPASQVSLHIGQDIFDTLGQHWIHFCPCWQYVVLKVNATMPTGLHMQFEMDIRTTSKQFFGRIAAVSMAMGCCEGLDSNKFQSVRSKQNTND